MFADDLNTFKRFGRQISNSDIGRNIHLYRVRVHHWDKINRVASDPQKEHIVILHPRDGSGDPYKFLGLLVDDNY